jgi:hypothetical protein
MSPVYTPTFGADLRRAIEEKNAGFEQGIQITAE